MKAKTGGIRRRMGIGAGAFVLLAVYFLRDIPRISELHGFCVIPYFLRYQDWGLISRGLIGSLLGWIFPYLSIRKLYVLIALFLLVLCGMTAIFIQSVSDRVALTRSYLYLAVLFVVNPASVSFLFYWGNYGRFDLFQIVLLMAIALAMLRGRRLWAIPPMLVLGLLIHQGFIFMYFPAILSLLIFQYKTRPSRRSFAVLLSSVLVTGACFLYLQFLGKISGYSYGQVIQTLSGHTDYSLEGEMMVRLEYFTPVLDFIPMSILPNLYKNTFKILIVLLLYLPAIGLFLYLWNIYSAKDRWKRFLPVIPIVMSIPLFVIAADYGRNMAAVVIEEFVLLFTIAAAGDGEMRGALRQWDLLYNKYEFFWVIYALVLSSVGKFEAANILGFSDKIFSAFTQVF